MPVSARLSKDILVGAFRGGRVCLHLVYGLLLAVIYPHLTQSGQNSILKNWCGQLLSIFNIAILVEGQPPLHGKGGCLIVANHVSWLDIIVLNAIHPSRFVAKSEVRDWPVIGWLTWRCGTVFIDRGRRHNTSAVNRHIAGLFEQGLSIGLFPEGTSTDGKQVAPFHSGLIQPAIDAGIQVQPMALRYREMNGKPGSAAVFVGDMTLLQSIWQVLCCPHQSAQAIFTAALPTAHANRRDLAHAAHTAISLALQHTDRIHPVAAPLRESAISMTGHQPQSTLELPIEPEFGCLETKD